MGVLVEQRADPYVLLAEDGWYYFTASYPVCGKKDSENKIGYDRIVLRRAKTLEGLAQAQEVTIWHQSTSKKLHRFIWAPELHCINGSYYVLFTGSVEEDNVWGIRPHMLKCVGDDLMNPDCWNTEDESNLYRVREMGEGEGFFTHFSLDMTYFSNGDKHYVAWAEYYEKDSDIYLASVDPEKPWQLTSKVMLLTKPEYDWEVQGNVRVNEGPFVLKNQGKIYMAFSASAVDYTYCIGMLEADEDADLLCKESWKKYPYPFLTSDDFDDQCGPGHNSFVKDENGDTILVYHARPFSCSNAMDAEGNYGRCEYVEPGEMALSDPCRHARMKKIRFTKEGLPILRDDTGYLFVTFTDGRESLDGEQIYMAFSRDGLHFQDLNGGEPILISELGEKGVRDPFIVRSVDGKHFWILATDLCIERTNDWHKAQYGGSRDLIIWESDDLLHWSEPRSVEIGVPQAGCVWAPEVIYDKKREQYLVFFASMVKLEKDKEPKQRIYYSYTSDFREFTKAQVYIEQENHVIDTTIIEENGVYYRFSKDETHKCIKMDYGEDLMGEFTEVKSEILDHLMGVEGPEAYYLKEQGKWCLIVDRFAEQKGYLPLVSDDLKSGEFQILSDAEFDLGGIKKRHGSVIPITRAEYELLYKNLKK